MQVIQLNMKMLLKYFMEWVSWLAWDEGSTGTKCGQTAEYVARNSSLSEGAVYGKGRMVIFTM